MENENKTMDIPVWQRYLLDIKEANRHADFYIINGNRALIKRRQFEEFLDRNTYL